MAGLPAYQTISTFCKLKEEGYSDQILFIVQGDGEAVVASESTPIHKKSVVYVPANTVHNVINKGDEDMKLYTVYAPSVHKDGTIHATKANAAKEWE